VNSEIQAASSRIHEPQTTGDPLPVADHFDAPHTHSPIGVNPVIAPHPGPGETLVMYHPHSQCPMWIVPTTELHGPGGPGECDVRRDSDVAAPGTNCYAPFPTRADFEQAELFVNNNCSDKYINAQLNLGCMNGMSLEVRTSRMMHRLLACGVEEDFTDDSKVSPVCFTVKMTRTCCLRCP